MTMAFDYQLASSYLLATERLTPKPYITGWNRLEGRVRVEEFERALRAEVRDPLWFLTRQWQFLELKGDDTGSPIEVRLAAKSTKLELYATADGAPRPFPTAFPLEAVIASVSRCRWIVSRSFRCIVPSTRPWSPQGEATRQRDRRHTIGCAASSHWAPSRSRVSTTWNRASLLVSLMTIYSTRPSFSMTRTLQDASPQPIPHWLLRSRPRARLRPNGSVLPKRYAPS
jgi:hypothetical protein